MVASFQVSVSWLIKAMCIGLSLYCLCGIAQAEKFIYKFISLNDNLPLPPEGYFTTTTAHGINNRRQVSLTFSHCKPRDLSNISDQCTPSFIGLYDKGRIRLLHQGVAGPINNEGVVAGNINGFGGSTALFHKGNLPVLIPPLPNQDVNIFPRAINDKNVVLMDTTFNVAIYGEGKTKTLDLQKLGEFVSTGILSLNNNSMVAGTVLGATEELAFRYNTRTNKTTLLKPLPFNTRSKAFGINNKGLVVGYSYNDLSIQPQDEWVFGINPVSSIHTLPKEPKNFRVLDQAF